MTDEPRKRGFAALSPERRREVAAKGGRAVAPENRPFARDPELAAEAGRKSRRPKEE